jgi:dihydroxyacid dehydratase/phosphogluconate dehydratase
MLASRDKIIPGMLMASVRLGLPTVFLTASAMLPHSQRNRYVVTSDRRETMGNRCTEETD